MPITAASTVSAALQHRAACFGTDIAHCFVRDGAEDQLLSFAGMNRAAGLLAATLAARLRPQDRVVLVLQPGLEYSVALLACFRARMIAVPTFPPRARRLSGLLSVLCRDCEAALVLTDARSAAALAEHARQDSGLAAIPVLVVDRMTAGETVHDGAMPAPEDLAVLQYTSGSTGAPKGVMVTHRNLVENLERQCRRFGVGEQSRLVSWLPPYHDMGLVAGILQAPYSGCRTVLLSPMHAMQRPARWLQAISRMRATISGGPPFGYDLCVDTVTEEERAGARSVVVGVRVHGRRADWAGGVGAVCSGVRAVRVSRRGVRTVLRHGRGDADGDRPGGGQRQRAGRGRRAWRGGAHQQRACGGRRRSARGGPSAAQPVRGWDGGRNLGARGERGGRVLGKSGPHPGDFSCSTQRRQRALAAYRRPRRAVRWGIDGDRAHQGHDHFRRTQLHPEDIEATLRGIEDERVRAGAVAAFGAEMDGRERVVVALELKRRPVSTSELAPLRAAIRAAVTRVHEVRCTTCSF